MRLAVDFHDQDFHLNDRLDAGIWEPETLAVLERFLHPGDTFIDVGAWVGPVTVWACELGARVLALEPDRVAYNNLLANTHGMTVTTIPVALASAAGFGLLAAGSNGYGGSMSHLADVGEPVRTVTPEWLIDQAPSAALMKVDIEGGEIDVLPTLAPLCAERGIPLYLSWHEPWWSHPVSLDERQSWFAGFSEVEGAWGGWEQLLAVP